MKVILCNLLLLAVFGATLDFGGPFNAISGLTRLDIEPRNGTYSGCFTSSLLPRGLQLNSDLCSISGIPLGEMEDTVIVVDAKYPEPSTGSFHLSVSMCKKNAFEVLRTYGNSNVYFEVFSVTDYDSGYVFVNVTKDTPKKSGSVVSYYFCSETRFLRLHVDSTVYENWYENSNVKVYAITNAMREKDLLMSMHYDKRAGSGKERKIDIAYLKTPSTEWYYYMNRYPEDWRNPTDFSEWNKGSESHFNASNNHIQLYAANDSILKSFQGSYEMYIRYMDGCVVYINGIEVFRDHLPSGEITPSTYAIRSYAELEYHAILLPCYFRNEEKMIITPFVEGVNVIVVALIGKSPESTPSVFDFSLRFTGEDIQHHSFTMMSYLEGAEGPANAVLDMDADTWITKKEDSEEASILLFFPENRREVLSRIVLISYFHDPIPGFSEFVIEGRREDEEWEELNSFRSIEWRNVSQAVTVWMHSITPYNAYRLAHIKGQDGWRIAEVGLYTEYIGRSTSGFLYKSFAAYQDVEISPVCPPSLDFYNVDVDPPLPLGLHMDHTRGVIYGTPLLTQNQTKYIVYGVRFDGSGVQSSFHITINLCAGGSSLYSVHILTDSHPWDSYWELYQGEVSEEPLFSSGRLTEKETDMKWSFCLETDYYTFFFAGAASGWSSPSGYTISTNRDRFSLLTGTVARDITGEGWNNATVALSADQPIQPHSSTWRVLTRRMPPENWVSVDYCDEDWKSVVDDQIHTLSNTLPTYYLRFHVLYDEALEYSMLLLQFRYVGGIRIYFNGFVVFSKNLPTDVSATTYALEDHNITEWSKASVLLSAMGIQKGENILAMEIHRFYKSTQEMDMECIAQWMKSETEQIAASYSSIKGTKPYSPYSGVVSNLFDMKATTAFRPVFQEGTYWKWTFESTRVPFNQYSILPSNTIMNHTWVVLGRFYESEKWVLVDRQEDMMLLDREPRSFSIPAGMAGFHEYRYVIEESNISVFNIMEFFLEYVAPDRHKMCNTYDGFYGVGYSEYSYSECEYGYSGVARRYCDDNGEWGKYDMFMCNLLPPKNLHFPFTSLRIPNRYIMEVYELIYDNIADNFSSYPPLPKGMILSVDGKLFGITQEATKNTTYTIVASNEVGIATTTISIEVYDRYCKETKFCKATPVGETCELPCEVDFPNTIGKAKKMCLLDEAGETYWGKAKGDCKSSDYIYGILFVSIALAAFALTTIITIIVRCVKRNKRTRYVKVYSCFIQTSDN